MKKLVRNRKGQFVIIAALIIAVMIVSTGTILHSAVTYYKNEPWQEYSMLISNVELSSKHVVEISLVNFTNSDIGNRDPYILSQNIQNWQGNLTRMFPGSGMALGYTLGNGSLDSYSTAIDLRSGLNTTWEKRSSFSIAYVDFTLNVTSIGLEGYKFAAQEFLNVTFVGAPAYDSSGRKLSFTVTVESEGNAPVTNLPDDMFLPYGFAYSSCQVVSTYDLSQTLIYSVECLGVASMPSSIWLKVWDTRGILVIAKY